MSTKRKRVSAAQQPPSIVTANGDIQWHRYRRKSLLANELAIPNDILLSKSVQRRASPATLPANLLASLPQSAQEQILAQHYLQQLQQQYQQQQQQHQQQHQQQQQVLFASASQTPRYVSSNSLALNSPLDYLPNHNELSSWLISPPSSPSNNPFDAASQQQSILNQEMQLNSIIDSFSDSIQNICTQLENNDGRKKMECFPLDAVQDFKHVLYNLLVENHNSPKEHTLIQPFVSNENGTMRQGFRFNPADDPEKRIPELYAQHIRKARLDMENPDSVFIKDLYRFYLRACVELMSKYFEKKDKYTYLYDDTPLFVPNETLEEAELRLRGMSSRTRKKRKMSFNP